MLREAMPEFCVWKRGACPGLGVWGVHLPKSRSVRRFPRPLPSLFSLQRRFSLSSRPLAISAFHVFSVIDPVSPRPRSLLFLSWHLSFPGLLLPPLPRPSPPLCAPRGGVVGCCETRPGAARGNKGCRPFGAKLACVARRRLVQWGEVRRGVGTGGGPAGGRWWGSRGRGLGWVGRDGAGSAEARPDAVLSAGSGNPPPAALPLPPSSRSIFTKPYNPEASKVHEQRPGDGD